jgi:hypothetical protein
MDQHNGRSNKKNSNINKKKKGIIFHKPEIQEEKNRKIVVNLTWKVSMKIFR